MINLKIDNKNDFYIPSCVFSLSQEPIEDAIVIVTLGMKDESGVITGATSAEPIVIESATEHGLETDDYVIVTQVVGNKGANGVWQVTVVDATHFSLQGSEPNDPGDAYISGGIWYRAVPGIINLTLTRVQATLYKGTASETVNLRSDYSYISILDITNYGTHLEVDTRASHRTGQG
ncbi:MAG: hypothetical protein E6R03_04900 [Hyphomicrobiaceae bacterium]|nr:MAG: hypothetical protein E6R03_04900 [Hyphomicrobiaceae bacterium]